MLSSLQVEIMWEVNIVFKRITADFSDDKTSIRIFHHHKTCFTGFSSKLSLQDIQKLIKKYFFLKISDIAIRALHNCKDVSTPFRNDSRTILAVLSSLRVFLWTYNSLIKYGHPLLKPQKYTVFKSRKNTRLDTIHRQYSASYSGDNYMFQAQELKIK